MKKIQATLLLLILSICSLAQEISESNKKVFGARVQTNGVGLEFSAIQTNTGSMRHGFGIIAHTLKHQKEVKIVNPTVLNAKPYVYGKSKRTIQITPVYYVSRSVGKGTAYTPSLQVGFEIGPAFALMRPIDIIVLDFDRNENINPRVERYDPNIHTDQDEILGDLGWHRGFDELSLKAGMHFAAFMQWDWNQNHNIKRLKTGIAFEYYPSDIGMMFQNDNRFFPSVFCSYQIGKNH